MKTKRFLVLSDDAGHQISSKEMTLSDMKFREVFGLNPLEFVAPRSFRMTGGQKQKYYATVGEPNDGYYATVEWRDIPDSDKERNDLVKKYIRNARDVFAPTDAQLSDWLRANCKMEWLFEKHMKEGNLLLAAEELHVMTQCFYGQPLIEQTLVRNLSEARKMLALKV